MRHNEIKLSLAYFLVFFLFERFKASIFWMVRVEEIINKIYSPMNNRIAIFPYWIVCNSSAIWLMSEHMIAPLFFRLYM